VQSCDRSECAVCAVNVTPGIEFCGDRSYFRERINRAGVDGARRADHRDRGLEAFARRDNRASTLCNKLSRAKLRTLARIGWEFNSSAFTRIYTVVLGQNILNERVVLQAMARL
jgi:hypothetical protein